MNNHDPKIGLTPIQQETPIDQQWTTGELLDAEFPPLNWTIPKFIPVGLTILAGPPKMGKSWLSMQFASAVGEGGEVFGRSVDQGKALVFALEDNGRRLQSRLRKQGAGSSDNVIWRTWEWPGWDLVEPELDSHGYRLVVIDTMARALGGGTDQNDAGEVTAELSRWQRYAIDHDMSVLVVDHIRKGQEGSVLDRVRGSTAKTATADAILVLQKDKQGPTLDAVGRDMEEEKSLRMKLEPTTCLWEIVGDTTDSKTTDIEAIVLAALDERIAEGKIATNTTLAVDIQRDIGQVGRVLASLVNKDVLVKGGLQGREQPYLRASGVNLVKGQTSNLVKPLTLDLIDPRARSGPKRGYFAAGHECIKKALGLDGNG